MTALAIQKKEHVEMEIPSTRKQVLILNSCRTLIESATPERTAKDMLTNASDANMFVELMNRKNIEVSQEDPHDKIQDIFDEIRPLALQIKGLLSCAMMELEARLRELPPETAIQQKLF